LLGRSVPAAWAGQRGLDLHKLSASCFRLTIGGRADPRGRVFNRLRATFCHVRGADYNASACGSDRSSPDAGGIPWRWQGRCSLG
jgi:hypothetical protein